MNNNDNGKEFLIKLERLMIFMIRASYRECQEPCPRAEAEEIELLRRDLIDYLNLSDKRGGIMVKGKGD